MVPTQCRSSGPGIVDLGLALQQHADRALQARRFLRRRARALAADRERQHHAGEQHDVAHRQDDQRVVRQRPRGRARVCAGFRGPRLGPGPAPLSASMSALVRRCCLARRRCRGRSMSLRSRRKRHPCDQLRRLETRAAPCGKRCAARKRRTGSPAGAAVPRAACEGNAGAMPRTSRLRCSCDHLHALRRHAGHRDDDDDLVLVLEHVHRRLPARRRAATRSDWKNWRCRRSACSISSQACIHIQPVGSSRFAKHPPRGRTGWKPPGPRIILTSALIGRKAMASSNQGPLRARKWASAPRSASETP